MVLVSLVYLFQVSFVLVYIRVGFKGAMAQRPGEIETSGFHHKKV